MNKLLIISGPTATGKTALAIKLAKKFNGEIISADSRQIYKGLDIGTGKDHPSDITIHLVDIIAPERSFSVVQYRQLALEKITEIQLKNKLPILVGCSGFYIDSIINPNYNTFSVKPNFILRKILFKLPTPIIQLILKIIDQKTYHRLNRSDIRNPLRLVRKIEIAISPFPQRGIKGDLIFDILHLSLTAPNCFLYPRINSRVEKRLEIGHLNEIKGLLNTYTWKNPGLKVSAYLSLKPYFEKKDSLENCIQKWKFREHRDARRQKTWFKKILPIVLIDITNPTYYQNIRNLVDQWYNKS